LRVSFQIFPFVWKDERRCRNRSLQIARSQCLLLFPRHLHENET
jgi:hypothetical protein